MVKYAPSSCHDEGKTSDDAGHVGGVIGRLQTGCDGKIGDLRLLAGANLDKSTTPERQPVRYARQQTPPAVQPGLATIKRQTRIEPRHLTRQTVNLSLRNIRRVAQDQIESVSARMRIARIRIGKIPFNKTGARAKAKMRGICGGYPDSAGAYIDPDSAGLWKFRQAGEKKRAGPGAKIKKAQRLISTLANPCQRSGDNGFGIGARVQRLG
jgi:hypothetical protein